MKKTTQDPIVDGPSDQALLDGIHAGVRSPLELQKLAGLQKVAEVYVALDKLSLRKQFHAALARADIDMDFIVTRLKKICESTDQEVQLRALQAMMRTLGLDKYDTEASAAKGSWEEVVLEEASKKQNVELEAVQITEKPGEYHVERPVMPEDLLKKKAESMEEERGIYADKS